ncbi:MAG: hypothetical protein J1E34_08175 [Oscillospiraceae bacterium]|nr:hypothetical protein [Oscillospiraceae bacterium]
MRCFLGIDGGGTKTKALLCDEQLNTVSCFTGEGINFNAIGMKKARENLKNVCDAVLENEDIELLSVFIGSAALSCRAESELVREFCGGIINCDNITLDSDVYIGLMSMKAEGTRCMAVCGTGSMAAGIMPDGRILTCGGWGHLLGDEGSGYAICVDAVKAAIAYAEGYGNKTALYRAVLDYFNIRNIWELIDVFYSERFSKSLIAGFAEEFFSCVKTKDLEAVRIMNGNAESFAKTVCALLKKMPDSAPLGLWGGIFQYHPEFLNAFSGFIKNEFPKTEIALIDYPPEYGAVMAAREVYYDKAY